MTVFINVLSAYKSLFPFKFAIKFLLTSMREVRVIQPNVLKILLLIFKQFNRRSVHGTYTLLHNLLYHLVVFHFTGDIE